MGKEIHTGSNQFKVYFRQFSPRGVFKYSLSAMTNYISLLYGWCRIQAELAQDSFIWPASNSSFTRYLYSYILMGMWISWHQ